MFNQIISIDIIYYNILSFLCGNESKHINTLSKYIHETCIKYGYLFHLRLQRGDLLEIVNHHLSTIRSLSLTNFVQYPLLFYPSKIVLDNTLMDLITQNNKTQSHVTDISYQHRKTININFKKFPNIQRLHIKYKNADRPLDRSLVYLNHLTHLSLYHIYNVSKFSKYISQLPNLQEFYTNFPINHLNIISKQIKIIITHGSNDTITVSNDSNIQVFSNGYGMSVRSNMIRSNFRHFKNFEYHLHHHLLPKYNWYFINIITGIYSHDTNGFSGTLNTRMEHQDNNRIYMNFEENNIDNFQQNIIENNSENSSNSEIYGYEEYSESDDDEESSDDNYSNKRRRLNTFQSIWHEIYSY